MSDAALASSACEGCGTQVAATLLSCPSCHRLRFGDRLRALAAEAQALENDGQLSAAVERWQAALRLLPADAGQAKTIAARVDGLVRRIAKEEGKAGGGSTARKRGVMAAVGAVLLLVVTKGKFLLLGLAKLPTLLSMLVWVGVYWQAWGWKFAAGMVVCIYVHEMGHVAALRRVGLPASAPLFVPGLGAFVMLRHHPANPREDADIGLGGPEWGLGAALACAAVYWMGGGAYWGALARTGALINLFNLLPFWQLDGGRAFHALSRPQRMIAVGGLLAIWALTWQGLVFLLAMLAAWQAYAGGAEEPDRNVLARYLFLSAAFAFLMLMDVKV